MKFCSKCGKEIMDEAVICVHCGCQIQNSSMPTQQMATNIRETTSPSESSGLGTCALVFAFLMPILGLILGIVGACKYKPGIGKGKSVSAIFLSIGVWIISYSILSCVMII